MNDVDVLDAIRDEIQAEHSLISHRMTWLVTSQSFLMTAYAVSWNLGYQRPVFFHNGIPLLGFSISLFASIALICAVVAQWHMIEQQTNFITEMIKKFENSGDAALKTRVSDYKQITCKGRKTRDVTHWLAMMPPVFVPILFLVTWIVAYWWGRAR